jgi:hypothetical protein
MRHAARAVVRTYRFGARGDYDSDDYDDEEEEGVREVMRLVQRQNGRLIPASMRSTSAPPVSVRPVGTPRASVSAVTAAVSDGDARLEPYGTMVWKYSEFAVSAPGAEYAAHEERKRGATRRCVRRRTRHSRDAACERATSLGRCAISPRIGSVRLATGCGRTR